MELNIKDFPKEIILDIFTFLSSKDLCSLALTCKSFNKLISSSSKLCEKFQVLLTSHRKKSKWIGSRKYQHFKIHSCSQQEVIEYVKVFEQYGEHVKSLDIMENSFKVETLASIFTLCPNVKYINFNHNYPNRLAEHGVMLPNLVRLDYEGESLCMGNFNKARSLKALSMSGSFSWSDIYLERFLSRQTQLVNLRLTGFDRSGFFLTSPTLNDKIQFRLTTLSLINISYPRNTTIFRDFLDLHKDTLRFLEIGNVQFGVLRYFSDFPNLKTVKIISLFERLEINLDNYQIHPMGQVENLIIDNQNLSNFSTKFPNIVTLETRKLKLKTAEIKQLKRLQKLTVVESKRISNLAIPKTLHELKLVSCHFHGNKILTSNRKSIEKLSIIGCKNVEWLSSFLHQQKLKLRRLEVIETSLSHGLYHNIMSMDVERLIVSSNKLVNGLQIFRENFSSFFGIFVDCILENDD